MRPVIISKTAALLEQKGFHLASFIHSNSCFDLAARKQGQTLLIKVLANIDALRKDSALELKRVGLAFRATPIVVGLKSKAFDLQDGIVYDRYGINAVSLETLNSILEEKLPSVRYFKGRQSVELDFEELRQKRRSLDFTLSDLADKIGVTRKSMHNYEKGLSASLETGLKLEKELGCSLIKEINPLKEKPKGELKESQFFDPAFERMKELGLNLSFFQHAPFRATEGRELLIDRAFKQDLRRKAMVLGQTRKVLDTHAMVLAKKSKVKAIDSTPIIEEEELESLSKPKDLMSLIKEREKA
jgi:putative transcriptional regulator